MKDRVFKFASFVNHLHERNTNFCCTVLKLIDKHLGEGKTAISLNPHCLYITSVDKNSNWKTAERGVPGKSLFDSLIQDNHMRRQLTGCPVQYCSIDCSTNCHDNGGFCCLSVSSPNCSTVYKGIMQQAGLRDHLILPLCYDGQHFGNLSIFRGQNDPCFSQEDLLVLQEASKFISSALFLDNRNGSDIKYYFRRFLYDMNVGAALVDRQLYIQDANPSFQEYFEYIWKEGTLKGMIPYVNEDESVLSGPQKLINHFGYRLITRPTKLRCDCMLYNFQISTKPLAYPNPFGEIETIYLIYVSQYKKIHSEEILSLLSELTPRENEVLMLLTEGNDNNQISEKLHITIYTVKSHLQSIYRKLDVTNKTELITRLYG